MAETGQDRRKFERFSVNAPAIIEAEAVNARQLTTRDISAGGAFFMTADPFEVGSRLIAEIVIPNDTITSLSGTSFQLRVDGEVVRIENGGMAVRFISQEIMPLGSVMDN